MISRVFPAYHPRKGDRTYFREKILCKDLTAEEFMRIPAGPQKITTIRENYDLWARRAEKINRGEAILSLRQWSGKPYASKQVEFIRLEKIGVQKVKIITGSVAPGIPKSQAVFVDNRIRNIHEVANNDGLSVDDFCKWFKKDIDGVCIHFTDFKY